MSEPLAYELDEWCREAKHSRSRAYELISAGKLKAHKAGRKILITPESSREYFASLPAAVINLAPKKRSDPDAAPSA